MDTAQCYILITDAFNRLESLQRDRETIETEVMKLEQFIAAAANMLPDDAKDAVLKRMSLFQQLVRLRDVGLTEAIRAILQQEAGNWLTVTNVRDRLIGLGFDFSGYSTNPLASISTTLRRLKEEEVETRTVDGGVVAYRWRQPTKAEKAEAIKRAMITRKSSQPVWGGLPPMTKSPLADMLIAINEANKKK